MMVTALEAPFRAVEDDFRHDLSFFPTAYSASVSGHSNRIEKPKNPQKK
jgi:hypothetical protein